MSDLKLSTRQKSLIKNSWKLVSGDGGIMNQLVFYEKFFEVAPEAKQFFYQKGKEGVVDLSKLSRKFEYTMNCIIEWVTAENGDGKELSSTIEEVGHLHNKLNVESRYYTLFSKAMISLISEILDNRMTKEIEEAWKIMLEQLAVQMMAAPEVKQNRFQKLLTKLFG